MFSCGRYIRESARGKGIPVERRTHSFRPKSELSLEDRRKHVEKAKANSTCRQCGARGHWTGDACCTASSAIAHFSTKGKGGGKSKGRGKGKPSGKQMAQSHRGAAGYLSIVDKVPRAVPVPGHAGADPACSRARRR